MTALRISEAAAASGVPASTLRYWEQIGLIDAPRTPAGYRSYDDRAVERLRFIGAAKRLQLSLDAIRDLLPAWDEHACRSVKHRLRPLLAERLAEAERGIGELVELAGTLREGLDRLDRLPDRDDPCDPSCELGDEAGPVIACSLGAGDQAARLERWHALLRDAPVSRAPLVAHAEVPAAAAGELAELVRDEQACCPFLGFALDFHGPTVALTVTAPRPEAQPFVDALLPDLRG